MTNQSHLLRATAAVASALLLLTSTAFAAPPQTSLYEGSLRSTGGGAAADGKYTLSFAIYGAQSGGSAIWTEADVDVIVSGGLFSLTLGSKTPIDVTKIAAAKAQWLGVKVGAEPELPRQRLHSVLFARHALLASVASSISCTACIPNSALKFDGDLNLGGNSIKAKNAIISGAVSATTITAATVSAQKFVGDGSALTGIQSIKGECSKQGEVVKGINADGTLKCVSAAGASLPADGIGAVSNNQIYNKFTDTVQPSQKKVPIPDNQGIDAVSAISFPDIGKSETFAVNVQVENTDLAAVTMVVLPPDDKKTGWTLCDPCGKTGAKVFNTTYDVNNLPKSGDLKKWIGANPKGLWTLKVTDTAFCVPQVPGNQPYCNIKDTTDGWITNWSIQVKTLANNKIAVSNDLYVNGSIYGKDNGYGNEAGPLKVGTGLKLGSTDSACDKNSEGVIRYLAKNKAVQVCNGTAWISVGGGSTYVDKPATYRWAVFDTHANSSASWLQGNDAKMYGGVNPSNWTDGGYKAYQMTSDTDQLATIFNRKGYARYNSTVYSQIFNQYSSTTGRVSMALFRVKNDTSKAISWPVSWRYTAYSGWAEYASVAVNGANVWNGNCGGSVCSRNESISIPAGRTSTVIFVSTSNQGYSTSGRYIRANVLAFYNNSLKLPGGLEFVDDLEHKPDGWTGGSPVNLKPSVYRWGVWDTHADSSASWLQGNDSTMYGGIKPQIWTDGNGSAYQMSSSSDTLMAAFNRKGYAKYNSTIYSQIFNQYSSTTGRVSGALFRIKNTTSSNKSWTLHWRYTSYSGWSEVASISLNGANVWNGNCGSSVCSRSNAMTIPAGRTSTVILISTSNQGYSNTGRYIRANVLAVYNNSLKLPDGLEFVDDMDVKPDGWNN